MKSLTIIKLNGQLLVDSREVGEMVGKRHDNLVRDIKGYKDILEDSSKLSSQDFFMESTYSNAQNKLQPCYLLTKKGCDMVANKMTGEKGVLFTAEYVTRFEEMENKAKVPRQLTALEQLQLQNQAILEVNDKVAKLQNDMPLFKAECDELVALVRKIATNKLGGYKTQAYNNKPLRSKVYSDIQYQLRREFGVDKYAWIKHSQFDRAKDVVSAYVLPTVLKEDIYQINSQIEIEAI